MAKKIKLVCGYCGKPIYVTPARKSTAKFCSRKCYAKWRSENITGEKSSRWKAKTKCICKQCGKEFEVTPSVIRGGGGIFCSRECRGKWQSENTTGKIAPCWNGGKVKRVCKQCGKKFKEFPSRIKEGRGKYCSSECYYKAQGGQTKQVCEYCGKSFLVDNNVVKKGHGIFCSNECKYKWQSIHFKGRSMVHVRKKQQQKPSKPEKIFQKICQKNNLPFHYVGDGQLWIGKDKKMNPDFIEANGKKICVEIMGTWWHSRLLNQKLREDALLPYREKHYKRYKWQPIFIWDTDLLRKDTEQFVLNELRKNDIIYERR